jgi:hypothetical protein
MPTTLNDDPSEYPADILVPVGGDPRTDSSVQVPFQQLANRTAYLLARADDIAPAGRGVVLLRRVANDAALLALGPMERRDGSVCLVAGVGLYEFLAASTANAQVPWVRIPADLQPGAPGRWILLPFGTVGAGNGLAQLDPQGRLPVTTARNAVVRVAYVTPASFTTSNTAYTDVPSASIIQELAVGDIVFADYSATLTTSTSGTQVSTQLAVVPPSGPASFLGSIDWTNLGQPLAPFPTSALGVFKVAVNGDHLFKLRLAGSGGGSFSMNFPVLRLFAIRP